jgi:hypothetical protein
MRRTLPAFVGLMTIVAAVTGGSTVVEAHPHSEGHTDTFNVAHGTRVHGTNSGDAVFVFGYGIGLGTTVVTCKVATFIGTARNSLKIGIGQPAFNNGGKSCTDINRSSLGCYTCIVTGTDTFTSNNTNGKWLLEERDFNNNGAGDDRLPEPNATGDKVTITIPKAGLVDVNTTWEKCTITYAPWGAG